MKQGFIHRKPFSMKILIIGFILLAGCSFSNNKPTSLALYDLGLRSNAEIQMAPIDASIMMTEITAPIWLASPAMQYRLMYHDLARTYHYAHSRWVTAPAKLLTRRIQDDLSQLTRTGIISNYEGLKSDYVLHIELEEFTQVFDQPQSSRAMIRLRANLVARATRQLISQQKFSVERATATADAAGAVAALIQLSDQVSLELMQWLTRQLAEPTRG